MLKQAFQQGFCLFTEHLVGVKQEPVSDWKIISLGVKLCLGCDACLGCRMR